MLGDDDRAELCDSLPIAYMRWDVAEWRWGCLRLERSAVGRGARYVLSLSVLRMTELPVDSVRFDWFAKRGG